MKTALTILFALCLIGCGKGPAVVTMADSNKTKEPAEELKPLPGDLPSLKALAEKGNAKAQYKLADWHLWSGKDISGQVEALKWYHKAAEQGHAEAQYRLAEQYHDGIGTERDLVESIKWLRKAAEHGNIGETRGAQNWLGILYDEGVGTPEDDKEAVKWWWKAAEQGDVDALSRLAPMYIDGFGVKRDIVTAYAVYNILASIDWIFQELYKKGKNELKATMTPEQITKGQLLSREMLKKNPKLMGK